MREENTWPLIRRPIGYCGASTLAPLLERPPGTQCSPESNPRCLDQALWDTRRFCRFSRPPNCLSFAHWARRSRRRSLSGKRSTTRLLSRSMRIVPNRQPKLNKRWDFTSTAFLPDFLQRNRCEYILYTLHNRSAPIFGKITCCIRKCNQVSCTERQKELHSSEEDQKYCAACPNKEMCD